MIKTATWGLMFLICFGGAMTITGSTYSQETGLEALKAYEGVWDCEFSIGTEAESDTAKRFSGVVTGKWVVGEKFLEQTGIYQLDESSPPLTIKTMMTYNEKQKRFQYDYFISSGEVRRSYGQWDADAKKMTSKMTDAESGNISTIVADFLKPGVEHWLIETKNNAGETLTKIAGTNRLRKSNRP